MKLSNSVTFNNCLFIYDHLKDTLPNNFSDYFKTIKDQHNYNTRSRTNNKIVKENVRTKSYGLNSIKFKATSDWNNMVSQIEIQLDEITKNKFKMI